jgi:hypothetical protein
MRTQAGLVDELRGWAARYRARAEELEGQAERLEADIALGEVVPEAAIVAPDVRQPLVRVLTRKLVTDCLDSWCDAEAVAFALQAKRQNVAAMLSRLKAEGSIEWRQLEGRPVEYKVMNKSGE